VIAVVLGTASQLAAAQDRPKLDANAVSSGESPVCGLPLVLGADATPHSTPMRAWLLMRHLLMFSTASAH